MYEGGFLVVGGGGFFCLTRPFLLHVLISVFVFCGFFFQGERENMKLGR